MRDATLGALVLVLGATLGYIAVMVVWLPIHSTKTTNAATILQKMTRHADFPMMDCDEVAQNLENDMYSWQEINSIRRHVVLHEPECFSRLFSIFSYKFRARIQQRRRYYYLHIPKAAGTSLCQSMRLHNFTTPDYSNCNYYSLRPYWCCAATRSLHAVSCEALTAIHYTFVANERWMDYENNAVSFCKDWIYMISIREPLERLASHLTMWYNVFDTHTLFSQDERMKRLDIIKRNYMTWSLVSGNTADPTSFRAQAEHLELAKATLSQFDFILDIFSKEKSSRMVSCQEQLWNYMGITRDTSLRNNTMRHGSKRMEGKLGTDLKSMNAVDVELYKYGQELIQADCKFFQLMTDTDSRE